MTRAKNYCRMPIDATGGGPWCFTTDPNVQWEYCAIPGFTVGEVRTKLWYIADKICLYVFPVIVLIGTVFNILSICTFRQPTLLKKPISFLFIILAVVDTLALYMGAFEQWLKHITGVHLSSTNNLSCQIFGYIWGIIYSSPGWILTVVSFERVISMAMPFKTATICTRANVTKLLIALLVCISLVHIPILLYAYPTYEIIQSENSIKQYMIGSYCNWGKLPLYARTVIAFIQCYLPSGLMLLGSMIIIFLLYRIYKKRRVMKSTNNDLSDFDQIISIAFMLLATCFIYLILTLPYAIDSIGLDDTFLKFGSYTEYISAYMLYYRCSKLCHFINNSINFLLYCIAGKPFRKEFISMLTNIKCLNQDSTQNINNSAQTLSTSKQHISLTDRK